MGGSSPYAFVNIGKGASEAAKGFNEDMKEFRKLDREYRKELQQLQSMQNQETLMLTTEGKKRFDRIQDKVEQTKLKRAEVAFSVGQNAVKNSIEDRRTAEAANAALERTIYTTKADAASKQAQMESQANIALAQIAAQERVAGRPAAEVQSVREYAAAKGIPYDQAFREMAQARAEPRTRAMREKEFLENPLLIRKYGTFDNYERMTQAGGTKEVDYKGRYGLE
jgi:DNA polymerase III alpha subunit (gram-positive type)